MRIFFKYSLQRAIALFQPATINSCPVTEVEQQIQRENQFTSFIFPLSKKSKCFLNANAELKWNNFIITEPGPNQSSPLSPHKLF